MNVISLVTLRLFTNYTTIYRGRGAKNAAIAHCRSGVTNKIEQTKSNKRTKAVTCRLKFDIRSSNFISHKQSQKIIYLELIGETLYVIDGVDLRVIDRGDLRVINRVDIVWLPGVTYV